MGKNEKNLEILMCRLKADMIKDSTSTLEKILQRSDFGVDTKSILLHKARVIAEAYDNAGYILRVNGLKELYSIHSLKKSESASDDASPPSKNIWVYDSGAQPEPWPSDALGESSDNGTPE